MSTLKRVPLYRSRWGGATLQGLPISLRSGSNDTVVAWLASGGVAYVLSYSYSLGYAGLSMYEKRPGTWELYGEAFLQGEECPQDLFGKSDASIRNCLMEYLL